MSCSTETGRLALGTYDAAKEFRFGAMWEWSVKADPALRIRATRDQFSTAGTTVCYRLVTNASRKPKLSPINGTRLLASE